MLSKEHSTLASGGYMKKQSDVTESMRAILIDWLVDVHFKFKLLPETLFLTVNLIDRFLSVRQISRNKLQLVGVCSLMIATKYEEIYPPTVKDMEYITDNAYKREEILQMEQIMLVALDFDIQQTSSYRFLERMAKIARIDQVQLALAQYLLELTLLDSKMN